MSAKPASKKAAPEPEPPAVSDAEVEPAADAGDIDAEDAEEAPPPPANRAERRALAKGKPAPSPVGKVKQFGRGAQAGQTPRHWQGRRGG